MLNKTKIDSCEFYGFYSYEPPIDNPFIIWEKTSENRKSKETHNEKLTSQL